MMRTASIKLAVTPEQASRLASLQAAYADACNRLVPIVREHRLWNRVALHQRGYTMLRAMTPLGSQMGCNAIFSVCKAYKTLGRIKKDSDVPLIRFNQAAAGIAVEYVNPAYTSKTCSGCGSLSKRSKHRFECSHCGLRAHSVECKSKPCPDRQRGTAAEGGRKYA